jgi:hypothetical protein
MDNHLKKPTAKGKLLESEDYDKIRKKYNSDKQVSVLMKEYGIGYKRLKKIIEDKNYLAGGGPSFVSYSSHRYSKKIMGGTQQDYILNSEEKMKKDLNKELSSRGKDHRSRGEDHDKQAIIDRQFLEHVNHIAKTKMI